MGRKGGEVEPSMTPTMPLVPHHRFRIVAQEAGDASRSQVPARLSHENGVENRHVSTPSVLL